jgi:hypothetical protein
VIRADEFTASADQLFGDAGDDTIHDTLVEAAQPQRMSGGTGTDNVTVFASLRRNWAKSASWNMGTGAMTLHAPDGSVVHAMVDGFENATLYASSNWAVRGTDGADTVATQSPTDFNALGGDDTFTGSPGNDTFDGGPGTDHSLGMGDGNDTCISVEILDKPDCEHVTP